MNSDATLYLVREGFSVVIEGNVMAVGGDVVEMTDDVFDQHKHKLEVLEGAGLEQAKALAQQRREAELEIDRQADLRREQENAERRRHLKEQLRQIS